jgi:hypothetical protein
MANRTSQRRRASAMRAWVVTLSLTDLAGVIGPGDRIAQSGEGRQEHRALELFIATSGRQLTGMDEPERRVTGASPA